MSYIIFYTDADTLLVPGYQSIVSKLMTKFGVNRSLECPPKALKGFRSGIDWGKHVADGAIAVILCNARDAAVVGIRLEAQLAELPVYEVNDGDLCKIDDEPLAVHRTKVLSLK